MGRGRAHFCDLVHNLLCLVEARTFISHQSEDCTTQPNVHITGSLKRSVLPSLALSAALLFGCSQERPVEPELASPDNAAINLDSMAELEQLIAEHSEGEVSLEKKGRTVELPAGSHDGLAAAIAAAGKKGTVIVKAGLHTESQTVTIAREVRIIGEHGAMFEFDTQPWPPSAEIDPALHIKKADDVVIWNVEIRPTGSIGGTAILVEDAEDAIIGRSTIREHQFSVLLEGGDEAEIYKTPSSRPPPLAGSWWTIRRIRAIRGKTSRSGIVSSCDKLKSLGDRSR